MAEEIIFGKISKGGHVSISMKEGKVYFEYASKENQKKVLA